MERFMNFYVYREMHQTYQKVKTKKNTVISFK